MKLDIDTISYILNVVKTARLVGIDSIIIEPNLVRAVDESSSVVLFHNQNVPSMPFGSIGLSRIDGLMARYGIAVTQDKFTIEATTGDGTGDGDQWARALVMKAEGIKIDYRCANPTKIKAPRQINDTIKVRAHFTPESVVLMQKGHSAMGAENVSLISNSDGVSFELYDVNSDVFKYTFADSAEALQDGGDTKFAHRYPVKIILALFKEGGKGYFEVGQKGILQFPLNDLTVFVLPRV